MITLALTLVMWTEGGAAQLPHEGYACQAVLPDPIYGGEFEHLGYALSSGYDLDGDDRDEVLASGIELAPVGNAWLILDPLTDARVKFEIDPYDFSEEIGPPVAFLGDINGGGKPDFAIADPFWTWDPDGAGPLSFPGSGRVMVWLGESWMTANPPAGSTLVIPENAGLTTGGPPPDIVIEFRGGYPAYFGLSLATADFAQTGDDPVPEDPTGLPRFADLVVGAPGDWKHEVIPGVGANPCPPQNPPVVPGTEPTWLAGEVMVFLGAAANPLELPNTPVDLVGSTHVFSAHDHSFFTLTDGVSRGQFSKGLGSAGDVFPPGGDGYDELLIGSPRAHFDRVMPRPGFVESFHPWGDCDALYAGGAGVYTWSHAPLVAQLDAPGSLGYEPAAFGWSVARLGDINGDDVGDFAVGAPNFGDPTGAKALGAVYVYSGLISGGPNLWEFPLIGPAGAPGPAEPLNLDPVDFPAEGDNFGFSIAGALGFQGDNDISRDEFVVGIPRGTNVSTEPPAEPDCGCDLPLGRKAHFAGRVYVIQFIDDLIEQRWEARWVIRGEDEKDSYGFALALGDVRDGPGDDLIASGFRTSLNCIGDEEGELYATNGSTLEVGP